MNNPLSLIIDCIESKQSFCFNSGAGSGKTYNLIKTIEYLSEKKGKSLFDSNQKIMVITYTNAATDEILRRIGENKICDISTIHTRLWEIIQKFQSDLLEFHLEKINDAILKLEEDLQENPYHGDMILNNEIDANEEFIKLFFKHSSLSASEFRMMFARYTQNNEIRNVGHFKSYVKKTRQYHRLIKAKSGIENKQKGYKKVEYDPFDNTDRLYKMKFSHDTLIDYSNKLVIKNRTIQKIISDKYPFILIDEFQDASAKTIELFGRLVPSVVIGLYGDSCQNIYSDGVGSGVFSIIPNLRIIDNVINRRSASTIVELGNRVRNDGLKQEPFNQSLGSVEVYYSKNNSDQTIDSFVKMVTDEFLEKKVDFFLLKNEQVAIRNGFGFFYQTISGTDYYRNNYDQTTTEILSDDVTKLGRIPLHLYHVIRFVLFVCESKTRISNYIPKTVYGYSNLEALKKIVAEMEEMVDRNTLEDLIDNLIEYSKSSDNIRKIIEENIKDFSFGSFERYRNFLFDVLYGDISENRIEEANQKIQSLLGVTIDELKNWYFYIIGINKKNISFHTFHGTKGLEFDNVGVVITNEFSRKKDYYHMFFYDWNKDPKSDDYIDKRNLLYVAVTRAKKNLRVLYLDSDFDTISSGFRSVFPDSKEYIY